MQRDHNQNPSGGRPDILCEEHPCSVNIDVKRNRSRRMARRMESDKFITAEANGFFFIHNDCIDVQWPECDIKTEGRGQPLISPLHNIGIEPVHYKRCLNGT